MRRGQLGCGPLATRARDCSLPRLLPCALPLPARSEGLAAKLSMVAGPRPRGRVPKRALVSGQGLPPQRAPARSGASQGVRHVQTSRVCPALGAAISGPGNQTYQGAPAPPSGLFAGAPLRRLTSRDWSCDRGSDTCASGQLASRAYTRKPDSGFSSSPGGQGKSGTGGRLDSCDATAQAVIVLDRGPRKLNPGSPLPAADSRFCCHAGL